MFDIFEKLKNRGKISEYQVAYDRQVLRNASLTARVENLKSEIERQHDVFVSTLRAIDPTIRGMTRHELSQFRTWLIELSVEIRPVLGCEDIRYGVMNLANGYTPDGETQLDLYNDDQKAIHETAKVLNKLYQCVDIDDD